MAVSGNQLTRLGAYLFGVGKKLVITAKGPAPLPEKWVTQTPDITSYSTQSPDTTSYSTQAPDDTVWTKQDED